MIRRQVVPRSVGLARRWCVWPFHHPYAAVFLLAAARLIAERGL